MPGGDDDSLYDELIDDGILESLIILTLAGALVFLIYYRQQRQLGGRGRNGANGGGQEQNDGQAAQGQQQPQDRGLFPQPGDPEFGQWIAGGVGH
jgi:SEL1 protein